MLTRYLTMIQVQRQDFNGRVLTIRRDDLRAIACILGVSYETRRRPPRLAGPQPHASERPAGVTPAARPVACGRGGVRRLRPHPVLRPALRLLRVRDLDRPRPPDRRLPRRAGASSSSGRPTARLADGVPPVTSVFFGGGTPSLVPPDGLVRRAGRASRRPPAPRSPSSATPTRSPPTLLDDLPARRRQPAVVRRAVDGAARAGRARAHPRPRRRWPRPSRLARRAGLRPPSTSTSSTAAPASPSTTGAPRSSGRSPSSPPHVSAYALTVEAGHAAGRRPRPPPRRRRPGRQVRAGRPSGCAAPASSGTRSRTGPGPATSAGTTVLYWRPGRLPRLRLRRPLAPRRPPLVERAHARALHRAACAAGPLDRGGGRDARPPRPGASRGCSWRCAPRPGVPVDALAADDSEPRRPGRGARRPGPAHGGGPAAGQRGGGPPPVTRDRREHEAADPGRPGRDRPATTNTSALAARSRRT